MAKKRWIAFTCCFVWAASIFATSSTVITPQVFFNWFHENVFQDRATFTNFQIFWGASWLFIVKGWHVTEFAVLTWLTTRVIDLSTDRKSPSNVFWAGLACILYAASDEWHQTFVPQRGGILSDVLIDSCGILMVGYLLYHGRIPTTSD